MQEKHPQVQSLRDVTHAMLEEAKPGLDPVIYKRCRYIIDENERLLSGCVLLEQGDIRGFGQKMYGSHEGLSVQYEVSCPELDFLVALTKENPSVVGARMMGGGFGGCTINLVTREGKDAFIQEAAKAYQKQFGIDLKSYEVAIRQGTSKVG